MSVTSATVINDTGTVTDDFHVEYSLTYQVITSTAADGPQVVLAYMRGIVPYGSTYARGNDSDSNAVCRFIGNARRIVSDAKTSGKFAWNVDVRYSTKGTKNDPADQPGDPLSWAWRVSGAYGSGQKWVTKDIDDRAIANSADEPFEDVPPIDDPLIVLRLEKNTPTISLQQWSEARGKVSETTLWGLEPRRVKLKQWTWTPQWTSSGVAYIANQFEVEIYFDGYYYEPADAGFREFVGLNTDGSPNYEPILIKGEIPTRPVFLNGAGQMKQSAAAVVYFDGQGANPNPFKLEKEYDFSTIFPAVLPGPITA